MKLRAITLILIAASCTGPREEKKPEKALIHNPSNQITQVIKSPDALRYYELGKESFRNNDIEMAYINFTKSLEIENSEIVYNEVGLMEQYLQNFEAANEHFKKAVSIDSTYWPGLINLGSNNIFLNNDEEAKEVLQKVADNSKSSYWRAYASLYLAVVYSKNKASCAKAMNYLKMTEALHNDEEIKEKAMKLEAKVQNICLSDN